MPDTVLHGGEPAPPYPPKQERLFLGPYPAAQVPQKLSRPSAGSSSGSSRLTGLGSCGTFGPTCGCQQAIVFPAGRDRRVSEAPGGGRQP